MRSLIGITILIVENLFFCYKKYPLTCRKKHGEGFDEKHGIELKNSFRILAIFSRIDHNQHKYKPPHYYHI